MLFRTIFSSTQGPQRRNRTGMSEPTMFQDTGIQNDRSCRVRLVTGVRWSMTSPRASESAQSILLESQDRFYDRRLVQMAVRPSLELISGALKYAQTALGSRCLLKCLNIDNLSICFPQRAGGEQQQIFSETWSRLSLTPSNAVFCPPKLPVRQFVPSDLGFVALR